MSAGFSQGTGGGGEASTVSSAGNSKDTVIFAEPEQENAGEQKVRAHAMQELAASLGAVAQAGREHGLDDTVTLDLPTPTLDRANEIYQDLKPE